MVMVMVLVSKPSSFPPGSTRTCKRTSKKRLDKQQYLMAPVHRLAQSSHRSMIILFATYGPHMSPHPSPTRLLCPACLLSSASLSAAELLFTSRLLSSPFSRLQCLADTVMLAPLTSRGNEFSPRRKSCQNAACRTLYLGAFSGSGW